MVKALFIIDFRTIVKYFSKSLNLSFHIIIDFIQYLKPGLIISTVTVTIRYRRYRENSRTVTRIQKNRYREIGGR